MAAGGDLEQAVVAIAEEASHVGGANPFKRWKSVLISSLDDDMLNDEATFPGTVQEMKFQAMADDLDCHEMSHLESSDGVGGHVTPRPRLKYRREPQLSSSYVPTFSPLPPMIPHSKVLPTSHSHLISFVPTILLILI